MRKAIKKVAPRKATNTLPKKANGGKVGTKSVASAGARKATTVAGNKAVSKLNNQGKPNTQSGFVTNYTATNGKGAVTEKWKSGKEGHKSYTALSSGTVHGVKNNKVTNIDTTGFAKGKRNFQIESHTYALDSKGEYKKDAKGYPVLSRNVKTTIPRKSVPKTLKKMQTFRKGGKKC